MSGAQHLYLTDLSGTLEWVVLELILQRTEAANVAEEEGHAGGKSSMQGGVKEGGWAIL